MLEFYTLINNMMKVIHLKWTNEIICFMKGYMDKEVEMGNVKLITDKDILRSYQ